MFNAMKHPRNLILVPFYFYSGLFLNFFISVYPTSIQFTKILSQHIYLPAYYGMVFSFGNSFMGVLTVFFSKRIPDFGMRPIISLNFVIHAVIYVILLLSVPQWSTVRPNDEPALYLQPTPIIVLILAFLFGMADNANNTSRAVITLLVIPDSRQQSIAASKFYHAAAASFLYLAAPSLSLYIYIAMLSIFLVLSTVSFWYVSGIVRMEERKASRITTISSAPEFKKISDA